MKMVYVLVAAVATGAAFAGVRSLISTSSTSDGAASAAPAAMPAAMAAPADPGAEANAGETVEGEVLEVTDVPNYSYLRLGAKGTEGNWVAVPTSKLKVGDRARVRGAMKMSDFKSATLNRTFATIYFGTLEGGAMPHGMAPVAAGGSADPHAGSAGVHAGPADPHGGAEPAGDPHAAGAAAPSIEVKPVPKATGPNGKTVAEVIGGRTQLSGKTVRVRATVVKSTAGVLGHTWLHLRDGSGDQAGGTNDLAATTDTTPAVGDTIVIEGVVATDRDVGAGYKFPTIIENAKVVTP